MNAQRIGGGGKIFQRIGEPLQKLFSQSLEINYDKKTTSKIIVFGNVFLDRSILGVKKGVDCAQCA